MISNDKLLLTLFLFVKKKDGGEGGGGGEKKDNALRGTTSRLDDVVDLQDHLDDLSGEQELLLLGQEGLVDSSLLHVTSGEFKAVDTDAGVLLSDLLGLDRSEGLDGLETRVLGKGHGDDVEGIGKSTDGVLLDGGDLVGLLRDLDGARDLGGTTTIDDAVVADDVAGDAEGIVDAALDLLDDHLVSTTDKDGDGVGVGAVLKEEHAVLGSSEGDLTELSDVAELVSRDLLEAGDDASAGGDGEELELRASDPADGGELVLEEEVVGLVVKAPLAEGDGGTRLLDLVDHVDKVGLLLGGELLVLLDGRDVEGVLGLGLGGLEGAGEEADLGVDDLLGHLRVTELLSDDDSLDEAGVLHGSSGLSLELDQVEVDVLALEVSNEQHGLCGNLSEALLASAHNLGAERSADDVRKRTDVVTRDLNGLSEGGKVLNGNVAGDFVTVSNSGGVDSAINEGLSLLEERSGEHDDSRRSVSDFVIL
mmetsp:Transcript_54763/g.91024  ORF Transcript_54763/g.91024 Transcript_54763/m.91024 type:complete len:479 (-) Transcript_54763:379-1815(-)